MLIEKSETNQVHLPESVARQFAGVRYFELRVENGRIILQPAQGVDRLAGIQDKLETLGISAADIADAVKWARQESRG